jgi:hypothetical protein
MPNTLLGFQWVYIYGFTRFRVGGFHSSQLGKNCPWEKKNPIFSLMVLNIAVSESVGGVSSK